MANVTPIGGHPSLIKSAEDYLGARGLTLQTALAYGIELMATDQIYGLLKWQKKGVLARHLGGLWIQHFDPQNRKYAGSGQAVLFTVGGFNVPPRVEKYCPPKVNNPCFIGWQGIAPGQMVVVCESVIKAIIVHKVCDLPTVGLNGVDGWSSGGMAPHKDLVNSDLWGSTRALVLFDSLSTTSERSAQNVARARETVEDLLNGLAGADLVRAELPVVQATSAWPKGQWGVDDFVVAEGADALEELVRKAVPVPPEDASSMARAMNFLNERYGVLVKPTRVVSLDDPSSLWAFGDFENYYKNRTIRTADAGGARVRVGKQNIARLWFQHETRRNIQQLDFLPGEEKLSADGDVLNLWQGFALEAADAANRAAELWYQTVVDALGAAEGDVLVNMLAALVQHPERKIGWYVFVHGRPGTGKNFIFEPLKHIFGRHFVTASSEGYLNKFNGALIAARVIAFSEMEESMDKAMGTRFEAELKQEADTAPQHRVVEYKGAEKISVNRQANVFMLSNFHPPWKIRRGDRRGLLLEMSDDMRAKPLGGKRAVEYWDERWAWMLDEGPREVLAFLRGIEVVESMLPTLPPMTQYKERLFGANAVGDLNATLDEFLGQPPDELKEVLHMRAIDLVRLTFGAHAPEVEDNGMLKRAGRYMQLKASLRMVRARVVGPQPVRYAILPQGQLSASEAGKSFALLDSYFSMDLRKY